ncbi:MAG: YwiC-like family protein [Candidatus Nanopelagicales bacterium]
MSAPVRESSSAPGSTRPWIRIPGQHGAWAFLLVPLAIGLALVGVSASGILFSAAWVLVYPASYYLGRAVVVRWRRGSWTRLARRELRDALPWLILTAIPAIVLVVLRPWLVVVALLLGATWLGSLWLTRTGHERGLTNDLILVAQASVAVPLLWAVTVDAVPAMSAWQAAGICLVFFTGSVLHVKSLIRGAGDRRWAIASRVFHILALGLGLLSAWLLVPFGAAAVRSFVVPQGTRPAVVGAVETVISVLVVVATVAALR